MWPRERDGADRSSASDRLAGLRNFFFSERPNSFRNSLLLQQLHRDTATGKAPRQEPAFPEFPTPECIEVQEERPPVNLSLCTPV